jgi:bidirectional [NiFe] hydrogenase diaphorase subunit
MPDKISIRIDGEYVAARGGPDHSGSGARQRQVHSHALLAGRGLAGGRLPPVHRGGLGRQPAAARLHHSGAGRHERHHQSEKLKQYRRIALELLLAERNHICAVCVSNNHCELQAMAQRLGVTSVRYPYAIPSCRWTFRTSASCWTTTAASCARAACGCARRWRARTCGTSARAASAPWWWRYEPAVGRGASCTSCGKCVQVCPTGALAEKGFAVEEMVKRRAISRCLAGRRGGHQ